MIGVASDGIGLTGAARLAGVIGWPVAHSMSPALHGYWLREHGIDGAYVPLPIAPGDFMETARALFRAGFVGANVTVPHKEAAFRLVDVLTAEAKSIGAVNTLTVLRDGRIEGHNSDGFGFIENLRASAPQWRASDGPALVLGAGGAARAVVASLLSAGAPAVHLTNRTRDRAEILAKQFPGVAVVDWTMRDRACSGINLLVNTTSLGMTGSPQLDMALDALPLTALVTDIVYKPLVTPLLAAAQDRGNPVVDGLGMLLHQGRAGFARWFGIEPVVTPALRAMIERRLAA